MERDFTLKIFDTKSRSKEALRPLTENVIRMYTCGPTIYNFAHIGNLRTYVFEDLLRRTIQYFGFGIFQVMNLTDIDDKTIHGAIKAKVSLKTFTQKYEEAFFQDLKTLRIQRAEKYTAATDHIPEMIEMIEKLIKKGSAYVSEGSVFFRIAAFPTYGALSQLNLKDLKVGASNRVQNDEYDKENLADFVLWKGYEEERDGDIYWNSPWGKGRPGWHIECSVMAIKHLGETLDLHVGGVDNIFPHHENEIAQSECYTGKTFARHWMHASHLIVDGRKMSKSLGNFYTLRDLLEKGYTGREVRFLLLSTHYRKELNFTFEGLESAKHSLQRIDDFLKRLDEESGETYPLLALNEVDRKFTEALGDDLNISEAFGVIFSFIRETNSLLDQGKISFGEKQAIKALFLQFDAVLDLFTAEELSIPAVVEELARKREKARENKEWARADELRKEIALLGFLVEDAPSGSLLKKK
ncbi:MAG: cysteine--tRNA ligase [Verrucomicrobia bacterium]|nr:cysteine--tRNA ligase [Verrucomicrobiota bacterium]